MFSRTKNRRRGKAPRAMVKALVTGCGALMLANCMGGATDEATVSEKGKLGDDGQRIVEDVFIRDQDAKLEKGKAVPKGTFILKPDQTKEDYIKSSAGPWEFRGLSKSAANGHARFEVQDLNYLYEVRVIAGNSSVKCPDDPATNKWYTRINADLNRGAGGPYLFLCASHQQLNIPDVRHITVYNSSSGSAFNAGKPTSITQGILGHGSANSDLNQGAGGDYVWARFDQGCPEFGSMRGIGVTWKDHWWEPTPLSGEWTLADETDLNYGAGGAYMWLTVKNLCVM